MKPNSMYFRHVFLICWSILLVLACGEERKSQISHSQLTRASEEALEKKHVKEWELHQGQSALLSSGAVLTFSRIREDSRCPEGVFCFWEGRVVVELLLDKGSRRRLVSLGLGQATEQKLVIGGQEVELIFVSSSPVTDQPIQAASPRIKLQISSAKSKIDPKKELEGLRLSTLYNTRLGVVELEILNGQASLIRDTNTCRIDAFGERRACTNAAQYRTAVDFRFMEQHADKYLYQLTGVEGVSFVIDYSFNYPSYRLIVRQDNRTLVEALIPVQKIKQIQ